MAHYGLFKSALRYHVPVPINESNQGPGSPIPGKAMSLNQSHRITGKNFDQPLSPDTRRRTRIVALALILLCLAACATTPPPPPPAQPTANPQQAFDRGNYAAAAREWQSRAVNAPADEANSLRISAAEAWLL